MSAYASLPGSFLPPFFAFGSTSTPLDGSSGPASNASNASNATKSESCTKDNGSDSLAKEGEHPTNAEGSSSDHACIVNNDERNSPNSAEPTSSLKPSAFGDNQVKSALPAIHEPLVKSFVPSGSLFDSRFTSARKLPLAAQLSSDEMSTSSSASMPAAETENSGVSSTMASTASYLRSNEIIIAIQSASVDPVRLLQSLTSGVSTRGGNIARKTASFISRGTDSISGKSDESDSDGGSCGNDIKPSNDQSSTSARLTDHLDFSSSPSLCYEDTDSDEDDEYSFYNYDDDFSDQNQDDEDDIIHNNVSSNAKGNSNSTDSTANKIMSSEEDTDAIQFELSINFQGRKYTATRAFPTFVKLRNDLLKELNLYNGELGESNQCNLSKHGCRRSKYHRRFRPSKSPNEAGSARNGSLFSSGGRESYVPASVSIPELPTVSPESYGRSSSLTGYASGVACRGFAYLQATAKSYCPEMEKWLKQVVDVVPCSPSLSRFLWEPLAHSSASWDTESSFSNFAGCESSKMGGSLNCKQVNATGDVHPMKSSTFRGKRPAGHSQKSTFLSKSSVGSLNSIEEIDGNISDESS